MKKILKPSLIVCMVVASAIQSLSTPSAEAAFTEQVAIDTRAMSLANNVTAAPPGILSVHYNPAGLSLLGDGSFASMGLSGAVSVRKTSKFEKDPNFPGFFGNTFNDDPLAGAEGTSTSGRMYIPFYGAANALVQPTIGFSHRTPGSKWTFAVAAYSPFSAGVYHGEKDDPSRFGGQALYQQHLIYAAPAVSYQVNKTLSVGASVGLGQTAMGANMDIRLPNELLSITKVLGDATKGLQIPILSELTFPPPWFGGGVGPYDRIATVQVKLRNDFSPSFNLGFLWSPKEWFSFGTSYQSSITANLTGEYLFTYSDEWQRMTNWFGSSPLLVIISSILSIPNVAVTQQSGAVSAKVKFPQIVNFGIKLKPFNRLTILSDLHWADWSIVKEDKLVFDKSIQILQGSRILGYGGTGNTLVLRRNFKDSWNWGAALEYQAFDWLTLRAGYENRKTSTQMAFFDLLTAVPDLDSYGAGFGIKLKNGVQIDIGGNYLVNRSYKIMNNGSVNLNFSSNFTKPVYNPYAGLNYEQKTEAITASAKISMPIEVISKLFGR
ncbi:MAG: outer membrane protein transport protein [Geobacteraceae bacterium]